MNEINKPAYVRTADTEQGLIEEARRAVSQANWILGECAVRWCEQYARGRTDADFGKLVGVTGDKIYKCRRVSEVFGAVDFVPRVSWSHYYEALNWDDAAECIEWAVQNEASLAEMKAWRRAMHGEDLTTPANADRVDHSPFRGTAETPTTSKGSSNPIATPATVERSKNRRPSRATGGTQGPPVEPDNKPVASKPPSSATATPAVSDDVFDADQHRQLAEANAKANIKALVNDIRRSCDKFGQIAVASCFRTAAQMLEKSSGLNLPPESEPHATNDTDQQELDDVPGVQTPDGASGEDTGWPDLSGVLRNDTANSATETETQEAGLIKTNEGIIVHKIDESLIPAAMHTDEFVFAFDLWIRHLAQNKRKQLDPISQQALLLRLKRWGVRDACESILIAVGNDWANLRKPDETVTERERMQANVLTSKTPLAAEMRQTDAFRKVFGEGFDQ